MAYPRPPQHVDELLDPAAPDFRSTGDLGEGHVEDVAKGPGQEGLRHGGGPWRLPRSRRAAPRGPDQVGWCADCNATNRSSEETPCIILAPVSGMSHVPAR